MAALSFLPRARILDLASLGPGLHKARLVLCTGDAKQVISSSHEAGADTASTRSFEQLYNDLGELIKAVQYLLRGIYSPQAVSNLEVIDPLFRQMQLGSPDFTMGEVDYRLGMDFLQKLLKLLKDFQKNGRQMTRLADLEKTIEEFQSATISVCLAHNSSMWGRQ